MANRFFILGLAVLLMVAGTLIVDLLARSGFACYTTALAPRAWIYVPVLVELLWPGGALGAFLELAQRFRPVPHPSRRTRLLWGMGVALVLILVFLDLSAPPLEDPGEWRKMGRLLLAFLVAPTVIFAGLMQTRLAAAWQRNWC